MKRCKCNKTIKLVGSPSSGWYTLCQCNEVGYFDDSKGNEIGKRNKIDGPLQFDWVTSDSFPINKK